MRVDRVGRCDGACSRFGDAIRLAANGLGAGLGPCPAVLIRTCPGAPPVSLGATSRNLYGGGRLPDAVPQAPGCHSNCG